ncbi:MAG: hypothetical protein PF518_18780 [Spirochaetaceae bacterium]|jgi:hypothetical protein|nr:hypothetical protein [Spirochaetaceae bacterium]
MKITFNWHSRENIFGKNDTEWALDMIIGRGGSSWTVCTYDNEPTYEQVKRDKELAVRAIRGYIKDVRIHLPEIEE